MRLQRRRAQEDGRLWSSESRLQRSRAAEEKNVKIRRRYALGGAAVNNETLHQHRDACGVFIA